MKASASTPTFQVAGPALLRACAHAPFPLPPWPDLGARTCSGLHAGQAWLRQVWGIGPVAEAIRHASPDLARAVVDLCAATPTVVDGRGVRRSVLAVARYLLRMTGRPTPFGLLAGVASAEFGSSEGAGVIWGDAHRAVAQPAAGWLAEIISGLEASPAVLARLLVVANSTLTLRGDHLIVSHQPRVDGRGVVPTEVAIRHTPAVRLVVEAAQSPVGVADLLAKLRAGAPAVPVEQVEAMLSTLVARQVLITNLHAPSTEIDPLDHLVRVLDACGAGRVGEAADLVRSLREIAGLVTEHNGIDVSGQAVSGQAAVRDRLSERMRTVQSVPGRHPLALDLRLDARLVLPQRVAADVQRAALVLARLSEYPYGTPAWRDYHRAFYERYGIGALVPLLELVDPDSGIGFPAGYPGTLVDPPAPKVKARDELLLSLAQIAAIEGRREIVLDEALIAALEAGPTPPRLPSHLEVAVRVNAVDERALRQGRYTLEVVQVSRNVGGLTGRFFGVLDADAAARHIAAMAALPAADSETLLVQASFPPLDPATAHVTRAIRALPTVLSLAEHRPHTDQALSVRDIAVGCDGRRLYLAVPAWGRRIEVSALHALNLRTHTPPLARFLIEATRAQCALLTGIRWGAAASLPYRPRLRYGRVILAPATWRLPAAELPGRDTAAAVWDEALAGWQQRRRMPPHVRMVADDMRLMFDLTQPSHRVLLRRHLDLAGHAVLTEVVDPDGEGWCANRSHEVIVPLRASAPPPWPPLPAVSPARIIRRGHGEPPAASRLLYAHLYGDMRRQDQLLAEHLPRLLASFDTEPEWWFLRYRDADRLDPHLRLRIRLASPDGFGLAARLVSTWADRLHRAGLLREVRYPTSYSETGRWGSGAALRAAERVFAADSRAVLAQLRQADRPDRQALIAAHTVAITIAYLGDTTAGMRWLIHQLPAAAPQAPVPRPVFDKAVRISNPDHGWAALRAAPGGAAIVDAWRPREEALATWRAQLDVPGPDAAGINRDDALRHILHGHYIRAYGVDFDDEPACLHLARAAAQAWTATHTTGVPA
ncbi:lantibiotic dehydratase [Micromonospora sp. CPCC 206061]|uniref:lantibiotic dehydratase n=1 Tax=Micromonospora sp. CPCC 206061 TaxID=3122410 RepID=UPI002FF1005E